MQGSGGDWRSMVERNGGYGGTCESPWRRSCEVMEVNGRERSVGKVIEDMGMGVCKK